MITVSSTNVLDYKCLDANQAQHLYRDVVLLLVVLGLKIAVKVEMYGSVAALQPVEKQTSS